MICSLILKIILMRGCSLLSIKNLNKEYAQNANKHIIAIKDISFQLNRGEFVSIVGPSGCGNFLV